MSTDRKFISASCARGLCGKQFLIVEDVSWTPTTPLYCSMPCRKAAKRGRSNGRCRAAGCMRSAARHGWIVCDPCWNRLGGMCRGKRRHSEAAARDVERRCQRAAKWCRVCGWWHNTSHEVEDEAGLHAEVGATLEALRKALGQPWVLELIESWDPKITDRKAWLDRRNTVSRPTDRNSR